MLSGVISRVCCNSQWQAHDRRRTAAVNAAHGHDMGGVEDELQPPAPLHVTSRRLEKSALLSPWKGLLRRTGTTTAGMCDDSASSWIILCGLSVWNRAGIQVGVSRLSARHWLQRVR